jgi:hypothetical protein
MTVQLPYNLLLALCLTAGTSGAAVYYVATDGDNANSGSIDAPLRTVAAGVRAANAGDTVIVRDGTYYSEGSLTCGDGCSQNRSPVVITKAGTPTAYITIRAENRWKAVLDCEMKCDSYFSLRTGAAYITIQDFVITRGYWTSIHSNANAHDIAVRGNRIEFIGNRDSSSMIGITGLYTNAACANFVIDGNVFHDIGRNNAVALDHALYLQGTGFTVVNNVFYNLNRGWAIQAADGLQNVLVANNTFASFGQTGRGLIMLWNTQSNLSIRNNIFYQQWSGPVIDRYQSIVSSCSIGNNIVHGASVIIGNPNVCALQDNVAADPTFVNVAAEPYDFHLRPRSPAIRAGLPLPQVTADLDGIPRDRTVPPSIGAYEFDPRGRPLPARQRAATQIQTLRAR